LKHCDSLYFLAKFYANKKRTPQGYYGDHILDKREARKLHLFCIACQIWRGTIDDGHERETIYIIHEFL
jgi:hypothetical protein